MGAKLIILAGIPGSGKSTWARNFFPLADVVSTDAIRAELYDGDYDPTYNDQVFRTFHERIESRLSAIPFSTNVVVADSTALRRQDREILSEIAEYSKAEVHLVFFENYAQAYENNPRREARWIVPDAAMDRMFGLYQDARFDIMEESYDSITYIKRVG